MNSKERVSTALNHAMPDIIPKDFGFNGTGFSVNIVYKLRQYYQLDPPGTPVKIVEPFQMLGELKEDLLDTLGSDCITILPKTNFFGFPNSCWKEWVLFDGTPVLVPESFNTLPDEKGYVHLYPKGDLSAEPSAVLPQDGYYFDSVVRSRLENLDDLDPRDNTEEFSIIPEDELDYLTQEIDKYYYNTSYAIIGPNLGSSFGDLGLIPGLSLVHPQGIRNLEDWFVALLTKKELIHEIFTMQCDIALTNYSMLFERVGNKINVLPVSGTDFGAQRNLLISPKVYRSMFKPYHEKINTWVHENTSWSTFIHSCGAVELLIEDFIEAGFDIINPVQISAENMEPRKLKNTYGDKIVFWGGGIDTQYTLQYGDPSQVFDQVKELTKIFSEKGGYIFAPVHNIQATVPFENITALIDAANCPYL